MNKQFRRKVLPAFALLAASTSSLAGVTYAWFSSNVTAEFSNLKVSVVSSSGGIGISNTATNPTFGPSLEFADDAFESYELKPLSTTGAINSTSKKFDFFEGELETSSTLKSISSYTGTTGYLDIDLYFENTSGTTKNVFFNFTDPTSISELFPGSDLGAYKSLRFAFITKGQKTSMGDGTWTDVNTTSGIIEPNEKAHLASTGLTGDAAVKQDYYALKATYSGTDALAIKPTADTDYMVKATTKTVKEYNGIYSVVRGTEVDGDPVISGTTKTTTYKADSTSNRSTPLFTLNAGYTWVKLIVWMEGQDCDCLSSESGQDLEIAMKFCTQDASAKATEDAKLVVTETVDPE